MPLYPTLSADDGERFDNYAKLFSGETDRGAAVLAGAYLDELVADLLRAVMIGDKKLAQDLLSPGNGVMGSFVARVNVAYAFGLIPEWLRSDLKLIAKVRNYFAHHPEQVEFKAENVRAWCRKLIMTKLLGDDDGADWNSRAQFILAVQTAMFRLNREKYRAQRAQVPED